MNSKLAFQVGLIFLGLRILRWLLGIGEVDIPITGTVLYQISILLILISIKLRIDEYLETKS